MRRLLPFLLALSATLLIATSAQAFCGFFVAKADTNLYNEASKVVLVRDGNRTVLTMANDFRGDPREFAMVIPVPTSITRDQIHVGDRAILEHLDAYSAPRLVEYFDGDPCAVRRMEAPAHDAGGKDIDGQGRHPALDQAVYLFMHHQTDATGPVG